MAKPNFKALAIDHGEKAALGFFGLIVLAVLATTKWSRYEKTPDELKRNVQNVRNKISAPENVWPKSEQEIHKIVDYSERSRLLFTPLASIGSGRFEYSTPLFHPLYRKDEPRKEPLYEPVHFLVAVEGMGPLSLLGAPQDSEVPTTPTNSPAEGEMTDPMTDPDGLEVRPASTANAGIGAAGLSSEMMMPGRGGIPGRGAGTPSAPNTKSSASHGSKTGGSHAGGGGGGRGAAPNILLGMPKSSLTAGSDLGLGSAGPEIKVRGVRYIAVRGVFPLKNQIENYRKALHLPYAEAANLVEIADFVLERQFATSNREDPWKDAKWETVMLTTAEEIIDECSETDPTDPVPMALKDPVITMPLPLRLLFTWGQAATHPKIKNYEMKDDEIAAENKLVDAFDEVVSQTNIPEPEKPKSRGFSRMQRDFKGLAGAVNSNAESMGMMKEMAQKIGMMKGPGGPGGPPGSMNSQRMTMPSMKGPGGGHGANPATMSSMSMSGMGPQGGMRGGNNMMDRLTIKSQYLLFRYLDFDVKPGLAYRYRVRLKLKNPNLELSPEELGSADPEIAKGEIRETPWSNISNPEVVPSTTNFYLKQVEREPYTEEKVKPNGSKSVAQLSMFDWPDKLGTVVNDTLNIGAIGAYIADEKKRETLKLDLANEVLEKDKDFKFSTMNVLLDVESDLEIEAAQHPDLKLSAVDKRGFSRVGLVPEALIAMESGEIELLDPFSDQNEEKKWIRRLESERKGFEVGKAKKTNRLDSLVATDADDEKDGKKKKKKKKDPRKSKKKKKSTDDANAPDAMSTENMQQQMMQRMMQSPGAAPPTTKGKR